MNLLATTLICLAFGQNTGDIHYSNQRAHEIPINVQDSVRSEMREYILYKSADQGRSWQMESRITPEKKGFVFYAPGDGVYWFQVGFVNRAGVQQPDEKSIKSGAPNLKMVIDSLKPIIRSFQANRHGDEIVVTWDVQEENPDLSREGLRLEYQVKGTLTEQWKAIPFQPSLRGQAIFNAGDKRGIVVRLTVSDLAKNQSYGEAEVAGTITAAGYATTSKTDADQPKLPIELNIPQHPTEVKRVEYPDAKTQNSGLIPPPDLKAIGQNPGIVPPLGKELPAEKVVADSRTPVQTAETPHKVQMPSNPNLNDIKPPVDVPATPKLPPVQYINQHVMKLRYELKRVGPSGIGGVEVWLTRDDGATWEPYAKVKEREVTAESVQGPQERDFEFSDDKRVPFPDGIYGLTLVVKNRAGVGRTPRPGDAPEIRVEIDTAKPVVQLFQPMPDPQNPSLLLLKWSAEDKNLMENPVNLEYAETAQGPWLPIETNLKNAGRFASPTVTGDFSWKVPAGAPVQVYLRVRVRDKAGNEGIAVTPTPQFIDLVEPEGALIGVSTTKR
jgi:hypothetical protein